MELSEKMILSSMYVSQIVGNELIELPRQVPERGKDPDLHIQG